MRKRFNPGELRTEIVLAEVRTALDEEGYEIQEEIPLFDGVPIRCKWVNVHGREVYEAERLNLREMATLTMRYSPQINPRCRIWKCSELEGLESEQEKAALAYEIVSMDDIQNRHELLEIKVKRVVKA